LFASKELKRIASDHVEVTLTPDGRIEIDAAENQSALNALLRDGDAHGRFGARPRREALYLPFAHSKVADTGLFIEVCPISEHPDMDRFNPGTRLISIFDGTAQLRLDAETISRFFPLSKSEIAVLSLVSEGYSNTQIAEMRSRSVETVNSQLKSLLRKTSARNRTELVRVAMSVNMF